MRGWGSQSRRGAEASATTSVRGYVVTAGAGVVAGAVAGIVDDVVAVVVVVAVVASSNKTQKLIAYLSLILTTKTPFRSVSFAWFASA